MTNAKAAAVLFVALLVASSFGTVSAAAGVGTSAAGVGDAAGNTGTETFYVVQGEECYPITAVGSGQRNVSEFYGYRAGAGSLYGSYGDGSQAIQQNQVSHVFVYDGAQGLSLVMLHDDLNASGGGAASFHVEGLPADREWVVEDDDYPDRDDNFVHGETNSTIHWMWADGRTDGAAVRGLGGDFEAITITPEWGEDSWAYQNRSTPWPHANDTIEEWQFQLGNGQMISLDKDRPITIRKGSCPDTGDGSGDDSSDNGSAGDDSASTPNVTLSVSDATVGPDESVTFEASGFAEACENATYEWDFDDDGDVDARTDDPTVEHSYGDEGAYNATVTVVRADGSEEESAPVTVEVDDRYRPPACDPEDG